MPYTAVDIHFSPAIQFKLACAVTLVGDWQQRWGQEGGLTLATVGVAGEDPPLVVFPPGQVHGIGVVAQHERWFFSLQGPQPGCRVEIATP